MNQVKLTTTKYIINYYVSKGRINGHLAYGFGSTHGKAIQNAISEHVNYINNK